MKIIAALWKRNLLTFVRNKAGLIFSIIFPFFFLYVFKEIFVQPGIDDPTSYMLVGIVITNVFQTALSISASTIDDISTGYMKEVLVSPIRRSYIAIGQILSATTISVLQSLLVVIAGFFIGLKFTSLITPILVLIVMIFIGLIFSGFGLLIATLIKNSKTYQIVQMSIAMPMTFISGAYIPINLLPKALKYVAYFNPMTYATALFRWISLEQTTASTNSLIEQQLAFKIAGLTITPIIGLFILGIFGAFFLIISSILFKRIDFSKMNRTKISSEEIFG